MNWNLFHVEHGEKPFILLVYFQAMFHVKQFYFPVLVGLLLLQNQFSVADSIPKSQEHPIYRLEQSLEQRKKRLDLSLKQTDAIIDSLTGNIKYTHADTLEWLYLLDTQKEREADERKMFWIKVGALTLLSVLAIGFYGQRKGWWLKEKRGGEKL